MASQIDLMNGARDLAAKLAAAPSPVKPNTLRSLVADFMSTPSPEPAELQRMLRLLKRGSGGHLKRSGSFPDQALAAITVLDGFLERSDLAPEELKTLFGWTARLLMVQGTPQRGSRSRVAPRRRSERKPAAPPPPPPTRQQAAVSRNPGTGELTATLPDGKVATVGGKEAQTMLASLPEAAREALMRKGKRRRPVQLEVLAEPLGRSWRIAELKAR